VLAFLQEQLSPYLINQLENRISNAINVTTLSENESKQVLPYYLDSDMAHIPLTTINLQMFLAKETVRRFIANEIVQRPLSRTYQLLNDQIKSNYNAISQKSRVRFPCVGSSCLHFHQNLGTQIREQKPLFATEGPLLDKSIDNRLEIKYEK